MLAAVAAKHVRSQLKQAPETIPDSAAIGRLLDSAFATFKDGYLASQITSRCDREPTTRQRSLR